MTTIYLATAGGVSIVKGDGETWSGSTKLKDERIECVLVDGRNTSTAYCGTFGSGLYKTTDGGSNWARCEGLAAGKVTALAVNRSGTLFAGTEPSEVFRSLDGGATWTALPELTQLASAREWSFPPRPRTHHVKAILADHEHPEDLQVAVEAGALVRSSHSGWKDRVASAPRDTHWLIADPTEARRIYSAAGDGFFESEDNGDTWTRREAGLEGMYCWSLAIGSGTPRLQVMSAAGGAYAAHYPERADAFVYRREDDGAWEKITDGLPERCRVAVITASKSQPGGFYLSTEGLVFRSLDEGKSWKELAIEWADRRAKHAGNIAVI